MKKNELNDVVNNMLTEEVRKRIMEDMSKKSVFHIKCDGEPIDTFESEEEANAEKSNYEKLHPGKQIILEPGVYESYEDMIDKLGEMGENLDMKNMKESKRSIIVTESQMKNIIKNLVNEDIPGMSVTKTAQAATKKDATANLKDVETKMKKAAKFDGNDNPEFPKAIGKGEKKAFYPNKQEVEEIEDNDNRGMQDLHYDTKPGKGFRDREKMYLQGDQKTGNSQDAANVVKSDLGKNLAARGERKIKAHQDRKFYAKEAQPVQNEKDNINEDIKRMKEMFSYSKKTQ